MKVAMSLCLFLYYALGIGKEPGVPDPDMVTIKKVTYITIFSYFYFTAEFNYMSDMFVIIIIIYIFICVY
jgi:hypothetical protein